MKFFIERFEGWLIRIGPEAEKYGDKYDWCLPVSLFGFIEGVSTKLITAAVARTAIEAVRSLGFAGNRPWVRITDMTKKMHIPSIFDPAAVDADGYLIPDVALKVLHFIAGQIKAGHYKYKPVAEPVANADGNVTFFRHAVNAHEAADPAPDINKF